MRVWARFAKCVHPDIAVVLGGPQTTFMPGESLKQMREADILCRGAGETVFLALADAMRKNRKWNEVPGICFREGEKIIETGPCSGPDNLDELPSPYLDESLNIAGKSRVILLSSRGCTSPCTFCYTTRASGCKVRFHSVERIISEMKFLRNKGIDDFWFADPNFAHSRKRLETLLQAIIENVPDAQFWCQTRYNLVDEKLLALLKRAGAHTIAFGLESVNKETLRRIKKGLDPERMTQAIRLTQQAGINVELFTLFVLPGEYIENAQQTLEYVRKHNVAVEGNSISQQLHLFFGTPISDDPPAHGIRRKPITKPAYQSICRDFSTDRMTCADIEKMSLLWRLHRQDFANDIDRGMIGRKAGSAFQFDVVFPGDYDSRKLAGKKVAFQAYLYQVMEPVVFAHAEDMAANPTRNMYRINDLVNLRKYNENRYYMVLRDSILHSFTGDLADMMALFNYYLKLGFAEKALDIAYPLPQEPSIMGHTGRVLLANGLPEEALGFLACAAGTSAEMENQRIKAHIELHQYAEAGKIASQPALNTSLQTMHLKVRLASLQQLYLETYLRRMDTLLDSQVKMMAADML